MAAYVDEFASYRVWRLSVQEDPKFATTQAGASLSTLKVSGRLPQQDLEQVFPRDIISTEGFGAASKGTMPGSGGPKTVAFQSVFQAKHNADDLRPTAATLEAFREVYPDLGRAPLLLFEWGHVAWLCWLGDLKLKWEGGLFITGLPKRLVVTLTLTEAVERTLDQTRAGDQPSTFYHVLRAGETPEHLAQWYLGDPSLGPLIRRDPSNVTLDWQEGDRIRVLPRHNAAMRVTPAFQSPAFQGDHAAAVTAYAAERGL